MTSGGGLSRTVRPATVTLVYASDPLVPGGGADQRVRELARRVATSYPLELKALDPGVPPQPRERLRAAVRGVPPRLSQRTTPWSHARELGGIAERRLLVAATTFSLAAIPRPLWSRTILDAHNLEWRIVAQLASTDNRPARRLAYRATEAWTRRYEEGAFRALAGVWAVSDDEADSIRRAGARRVWVVPNGVNPPSRVAPIPTTPTLLFVGSLGSVFNRDAVQWFIDVVWPVVLDKEPHANLVVVGAGSERIQGRRVESRGYVADLEAVYAQARCCIAPLRSGAGTRLKIIEALAHGRPTVSTTIGGEGLGIADGDGVLYADDPDMFAKRCLALLADGDLTGRIGHRGREHAARFGWDRIGQLAVRSINEVLQTGS